MRAAAIVVGLALLTSPGAARAESRLVDTILAEIGPSVVTLSDVTLARASRAADDLRFAWNPGRPTPRP